MNPPTPTPLATPLLTSLLATARAILRGLLLALSTRPRTPLRLLCLIAFDTLHRLRHARPLPTPQLHTLSLLLDFGASANAALDHKPHPPRNLHTTAHLLAQAGLHAPLADYARRLAALERTRPRPGDDRHFPAVASYREAVARLSLGILATSSNLAPSLDDAIRATSANPALNLLFRIVMHCQIIDDVLDYPLDRSAGLPTFLTATSSLPLSLTLTRSAAHHYATPSHLPRSLLPLRLALLLVSTLTFLVLKMKNLNGNPIFVNKLTLIKALESP